MDIETQDHPGGPLAAVIQGVEDLWQEVKKPVDVAVVMDISGSMAGEKINTSRQSLIQFINLLDDKDRLEIIIFNDKITTLAPLTGGREARRYDPAGRRDRRRRRHGPLRCRSAAYDDLQTHGDPKHIRGIVVLTDGQDNSSTQ